MPFKEPILIRGKDSFVSLAKLLDSFKKKSVFIVTDNYLHSINMDKLVYDELEKVNIKYSLYYQINANPTIEQVELGVKQYIENKCDSIIVIGGGSAIDAAKVIGARVSNIRKNINVFYYYLINYIQ